MSRRLLAILGMSVAALVSPAVASADYDSTISSTPDLLYHWNFESTGQGNLQVHNGATLGAPGAIGSGARFDGVDDYASVPVSLFGNTELTVEFWLKWDHFADDNRRVLELSDSPRLHGGTFAVIPNEQTGYFWVGAQDADAQAPDEFGDWNDNRFTRPGEAQWHHYAIELKLDAATPEQEVRIWVDGVEQPQLGLAHELSHSFANDTLYLMASGGGSAPNLFGAGTLDELAIYKRNLTPDEIKQRVDVMPETTITGGTTGASSATSATFSFMSDDSGAKLECQIDGGAYTACASPKTYTGIGVGSHTFAVRSVSQLNRTDATPATRTFSVLAAPAIAQPAGSGGGSPVLAPSMTLVHLPSRAASAKSLAGALAKCSSKPTAAKRLACRVAARARLLPHLTFKLNTAARVTVTVKRKADGSTASFAVNGSSGRNSVTWRPTIGTRKLKAGSYTVSVKLGTKVVKSATVVVS